MALALINKVKDNKEAFEKRVIEICGILGIPPNWLMSMMYTESRLIHDKPVKFQNSFAIGLIGFIPPYQAYLVFGDTGKKSMSGDRQKAAFEILKNMTNVQQLDYVLKVLLPFKGLFKTYEDLHLSIFYPHADKKFAGTLSKPDDWKFPQSVLDMNRGIFDGTSGTVGDFKRWTLSKVTKAASLGISTVSSSQPNTKDKQNQLNQSNKKEPAKRVIPEGYIVYVHTYSSMNSLQDLIAYKAWNDYKNNKTPTPADILNVYDNRQAIRDCYSKKLKKEIASGDEGENLVLGVKLKIPAGYVDPVVVAFDGTQIIIPNDDTETFISEALSKTLLGAEYKQVFKSGVGSGVIKKAVPRPRVWVWCKSLGFKNIEGQPKYSGEGEIFDLSPFIMNLQVSITATGGNFSFGLPPLTCECESDGWIIKKNTISSFRENEKDLSFISKNSTHKTVGDNTILKHNTFLFHNMIQENDVVFISFDEKPPSSSELNLKISNTRLPGVNHDMIGLVDNNSVSHNFPASSAIISISGRDLIKPLIEDSSYFLQLDESLSSEADSKKQGVFVNDNPANWGRPARSSNITLSSNISATSVYQPRTVGEFVQFIFSNLATIEICPDSLFQPYDNQTDGFGISRYSFYDDKSNTVQLFKGAGIWQIIKIQIDPENVNNRYVVNTNFPTMSGSLLNAVKPFIDGRFIEMISDTYTDQFFYIIRRPPYNKKSVFDYLSKLTDGSPCLNITSDQVVNENISWYTGDVYAWYRLKTNFVSMGKPIDPYLSGNFMPIVFFREYCEIWGNKALDVETNYQPFESIAPGRDYKGGNDPYNTQIYEDLAYLIESNAYLPFTRTGTIIIKQDRRIKRGIWFRYVPSGEIFYIDSVSHSYSIVNNSMEATTSLNISRGMVERNDSGQFILPHYFNLIKGLPNTDVESKSSVVEETLSDPIVLDTFFDFDLATLIDLDRPEATLNYNDLQSTEEAEKTRLNLKVKGDKSLESLLQDLKNDNNLRILLTGHTDEEGNDSYNLRLGQSRANNIKRILITRWNEKYPDKIDEKRISTKSMGERQKRDTRDINAVDLQTKREILAKNRRVEVQYIKTTKSNPKDSTPNAGKKANDYSKWSVNQEIFNFFLTRRQFCGKIDDFENLGNYTIPTPPTEMNIINEKVDVKKNVQTQQTARKVINTEKGIFYVNDTESTGVVKRVKTANIEEDKKRKGKLTKEEQKKYDDLANID